MRRPRLARRRAAALAAAVLASGALALAVLRADGRYLLAANASTSLPGALYLIDTRRAAGPHARGDIVAFAFDGSPWGFAPERPWAKRVAGLPGDLIERRAGAIWVNGREVAQLNPPTMLRGLLSPAGRGRVPPGRLFVVGAAPDSFDSRYAEFGLVPAAAIIGPATALL